MIYFEEEKKKSPLKKKRCSITLCDVCGLFGCQKVFYQVEIN